MEKVKISNANRISAKKLDELKSLLAKTTPGKWYYDGCSIAAHNSVELTFADMHGEVYFSNDNDAEFIVLARELLPDLIADAERFRSGIGRDQVIVDQSAEIDGLRLQVAKLEREMARDAEIISELQDVNRDLRKRLFKGASEW